MNESEICTLYRDAKDKEKAIQILTEMTLQPEAEIRAILEDNGHILAPPSPPGGQRGRGKWLAQEEMAELKRLVAIGATRQEIVQQMGVSPATAGKYIARFGANALRREHEEKAVEALAEKEEKAVPPTEEAKAGPPSAPQETVDLVQLRHLVRLAIGVINAGVNAFADGSDSKGLIYVGEAKQLILQIHYLLREQAPEVEAAP